MAIENTSEVDLITIEHATGVTVLALFDALDWGVANEQRHLVLLEAKLNAYLQFIESGQLFEVSPESRGTPVVVSVHFKWEPSDRALKILRSMRAIIEEAGFAMRLAGPSGAW
jgi:hypothetical protein